MSKLTIIGITVLVILLVGASMALAQGNTSFNGGGMRGMMNTNDQTAPGNGTYGPGMMGSNGGNGMMGDSDGNGMMGNGTRMSTETRDKMRDAMSTGNWDEMANICRETTTS
ncbi:MAG: hypothetical protein ACYC6O_08815 [Thermoleophilia bacterium]